MSSYLSTNKKKMAQSFNWSKTAALLVSDGTGKQVPFSSVVLSPTKCNTAIVFIRHFG